jgi:dienelactone hydrolase
MLFSGRQASPGTRHSNARWSWMWTLWLVHTVNAQTPAVEPEQPEQIERLGDEATRALLQIYDYDHTIPLEARTVEQRERDGVTREKVVFRGVQGFLVPGYLEYAGPAERRRACVLLLHGWSGSKEAWWQDNNYISGGNVRKELLKSGFAVLALDAQCHGDRISQNDFAPVNHYAAEGETNPRKGYFTLNEIYIQTTRDYRRAIDYLASRPDIDAARIGALGYSMGGAQTHLLTGTDERIKVAVAVATPAEKSKLSPVAPQNFLSGVGARPFLTITGNNDTMCSVEHAQARHALLENPQSQQLIIDGEYRLPATWVPEAIEWLRRHL